MATKEYQNILSLKAVNISQRWSCSYFDVGRRSLEAPGLDLGLGWPGLGNVSGQNWPTHVILEAATNRMIDWLTTTLTHICTTANKIENVLIKWSDQSREEKTVDSLWSVRLHGYINRHWHRRMSMTSCRYCVWLVSGISSDNVFVSNTCTVVIPSTHTATTTGSAAWTE
jgi:hypothetical protein